MAGFFVRRARALGKIGWLVLSGLLVLAAGGAVAAQHYLITSTRQISPHVLHQLRGHRGPRGFRGFPGPRGFAGVAGPTGATGPRGATGAKGSTGPAGSAGAKGSGGLTGPKGDPGANGQGPAVAVHNLGPVASTDAVSHSLATLPITSAGRYVISAKTLASAAVAGESTTCTLTAHDTGALPSSDDADMAQAALAPVGTGFDATLPLQLTHTFAGAGTVTLSCVRTSGTAITWRFTRIAALQVSSLADTGVAS